MSKIKFLTLMTLIMMVQASLAAPKIPRFTGYNNSSTRSLIQKTKFKQQDVEKHDGYKVIDKNGNVSYVDDIKNPKHQVHMLSINGDAPSKEQLKNVDSQVHIRRLCFQNC